MLLTPAPDLLYVLGLPAGLLFAMFLLAVGIYALIGRIRGS